MESIMLVILASAATVFGTVGLLIVYSAILNIFVSQAKYKIHLEKIELTETMMEGELARRYPVIFKLKIYTPTITIVAGILIWVISLILLGVI